MSSSSRGFIIIIIISGSPIRIISSGYSVASSMVMEFLLLVSRDVIFARVSK
jgi:hypothetical protein